MIESIPLSWRRNDVDRPGFESVRLPFSGLRWVHTADVPCGSFFEALYAELLSRFKGGFLIRGCDAEIARYLERKGCGVMRTGAEGVVDLSNVHEPRASVNELARRGMRWGDVVEVPFTKLHARRVSQFAGRTPYGEKPYLKYLFRSRFEHGTRCFVFRTASGEWLGVITVSRARDSRAHTELILRDKTAPTGVMEALITGVVKKLRDEGYEKLSLGEVPFVAPGNGCPDPVHSGLSFKEKVLFRTGRLLKFAFNYKGLYRFKDKFNPEWKPVYLCAAPALSYSALTDLFVVSRYLDLSGSEFIRAVRNLRPGFLKNA